MIKGLKIKNPPYKKVSPEERQSNFNNPDLIKNQLNTFTDGMIRFFDKGNVKTLKRKLLERDIISHCNGIRSYGFKYHFFTDFFSLDLDAHDNLLGSREKQLANLYEIVKKKLGIPSFVAKTKTEGGYHCYFKLEQIYSFPLLERDLKAIFKGHPNIEILPTNKKFMRLPFDYRNGGHLLDPTNLKPIRVLHDKECKNNYIFLRNHLKTVKVHDSRILFNSNLLNRYGRKINHQNLSKAKSDTLKAVRFLKEQEKIKKEHLRQGSTNEYLSKTAFNGSCNGIDIKTLTEQVISDFSELNIKKDKDTSDKRIEQRLKSFYRKIKSQGSINTYREEKAKKSKEQQETLFNELKPTVDKIVKNCKELVIKDRRKKNQVLKSFEKFIYELLKWNKYISNLTHEEAIIFDTNYKYFYHSVKKKKIIPLPYELIKNWYQKDPYLFIRILESKGYLKLGRKFFNPIEIKKVDNEIIGNSNYFSFTPNIDKIQVNSLSA